MLIKPTTKPYLSIIVPVYNEAARIHNLQAIFEYLKKKKTKSEVIVVNDGSLDNTQKLLEKLSKIYEFRIITYDKNRGKGYAIKTGMQKAYGEYRLFIDVDLSTPIEELERFKRFFSSSDVAIASRRLPQSQMLVRQSYPRELMGRIFTVLSRFILGVPISDFTCGFKCFSEEAAKEIFTRVRIDRWGFDAEALFLAKKLGYSIQEVATIWRNDPRTKVKFPQDIIYSLADLIKIRLNSLCGRYR